MTPHRATWWMGALGLMVAALGVTVGSAPGSAAAHAPSGPPVATFSLVGGTGVSGPLTATIVRCDFPALTGTQILIIARPADASLSVRITVVPGQVTVGVDTGSGAQYEQRNFVGKGVSRFSDTRGASINSSLTAVPLAAGSAAASLPVVSSISGSINCGGQTSGTSTLKITGKTELGTVSTRISPVNVSCSTGPEVLIIGHIKDGKQAGQVDMSVSGKLFSFSISTKSPTAHSYAGKSGSASASSGGARINGVATETSTAGSAVHKLKVVGRVVCGHDPSG
jgi:hypothetical protein